MCDTMTKQGNANATRDGAWSHVFGWFLSLFLDVLKSWFAKGYLPTALVDCFLPIRTTIGASRKAFLKQNVTPYPVCITMQESAYLCV